ncbi:phosphoribosylanthranilate isomerase [Kordiimonas aquimaris]|uniref:phosphoribosylanthranilate isomerase n=1 Tax=Kordiimonas aquimaris TaxID=707591 RepID=UPI0021CF521D|nr:phosphoribosylanthranilate isomerase [Kordiimonas aquimaris]
MSIEVKICGLTTAETAHAAAGAGASYLGFMFFEPSPRHLTFGAARRLNPDLPDGPERIGVFVNANDRFIAEAIDAIDLTWLQLHGSETPEEVARLKDKHSLPVIKAVGVSEPADIEQASAYYDIADAMLFDAKPPKGAALPGGNAVSFPWHIMQEASLPEKWLLAGGLTPDNIAEAVKLSQASILDVSSGVESEPGIKSIPAIEAFLRAAKAVS